MKYAAYTGLTANEDYSVFDFISLGKNGLINKRAEFMLTEMDDVYNLAFGDIDRNGMINDYVISNNGDRNKILGTIVDIVKLYTERFPDRWILFRGSTDERTRLYRMAVGLNLEELSKIFEINAICQGRIISFGKNMPITVFLIKIKII
jgi:hypothetical protein